MKKQEIIAEGHCGLTVELNLMDQYAITHAIDRMEEHNRCVAEREAWQNKRNHDKVWDMEKENRAVWDAANPEPKLDPWNWVEEIAPIYKFLKKLALPEVSKATVFDDE